MNAEKGFPEGEDKQAPALTPADIKLEKDLSGQAAGGATAVLEEEVGEVEALDVDAPAGSSEETQPELEIEVDESEGPVETAIVGYGFAGRDFHSYLVSLEPNLKLVAVASRDDGRRAQAREQHGVRTYRTLDDLLANDSAQLIVVATPHSSHTELAVKALDAGRHCVVDKAMCLTTAEAEEMMAAAERSGKMLSVFQNRRWDGDYLTLRKFIDAGTLGEVFLIEESVMGAREPAGRWRGDKVESGGPLYDWGAHFMDHAVQIAGCPAESVFCHTSKKGRDTDVETYVKCCIKFQSGLLYTIEVGYMAQLGKPKFFALGTNGAFRKEGVDPQEKFMIQKRIRDAVEDPANRALVKTTINGVPTEIRPDTVKGDWTQYYRNIGAHILHGEKLAVNPRDTRENIRITEAAMQSAETDRVVTL